MTTHAKEACVVADSPQPVSREGPSASHCLLVDDSRGGWCSDCRAEMIARNRKVEVKKRTEKDPEMVGIDQVIERVRELLR